MLKTRPQSPARAKLSKRVTSTEPRASLPRPAAQRSAKVSRATKVARATKPASRVTRPKRPLRVVVMMSDEEHERLLALCEDDVRPVASWFRVIVRRAWESRRPRRGAAGVFQRQEDDGLRRRVEVWTRLSDEERDQLDILAGEEDVSVAVWYRRRLREDWAQGLGAGRTSRSSPGKTAAAKTANGKTPVGKGATGQGATSKGAGGKTAARKAPRRATPRR